MIVEWRGTRPRVAPGAFVAPNATLVGDVTVERGASIGAELGKAMDGARLLALFGLLMVVMMRFRPEGMIPNQRRALEFHSDDEELVQEIEEDLPYEFAEEKS